MPSVVPDSPSIVLRSTHILLVRLQKADLGEWGPRPDAGGVQRTARLALKLEEVLKGTVKEQVGDVIRLDTTQYDTGTGRIAAVPGVWSDVSLDPGTELVAFSRCDGTEAAHVLNDPSCERLCPPREALADVRLALKAEAGNPTLPELLAMAKPVAGALNDIFAEYLWVREGQAAPKEKTGFEPLMEFLESPGLGGLARAALLDAVNADLVVSSTASPWHTQRLAVAMFRLLALPQAASLHDEILQPRLPNLLGLSGGGTKRSADEVFHDFPADRARALQALKAYKGEAKTADLLKWLH